MLFLSKRRRPTSRSIPSLTNLWAKQDGLISSPGREEERILASFFNLCSKSSEQAKVIRADFFPSGWSTYFLLRRMVMMALKFPEETLFPENIWETAASVISNSLANFRWVIPNSFRLPWSLRLFFLSRSVNCLTILSTEYPSS